MSEMIFDKHNNRYFTRTYNKSNTKTLPKNNNKPLFILINFIFLLIITSSLTRSISHLYLNKTPDYFIFIPFLSNVLCKY